MDFIQDLTQLLYMQFYAILEMSGTTFYNTAPCKTKWQKIKNRLGTCLNFKKKTLIVQYI